MIFSEKVKVILITPAKAISTITHLPLSYLAPLGISSKILSTLIKSNKNTAELIIIKLILTDLSSCERALVSLFLTASAAIGCDIAKSERDGISLIMPIYIAIRYMPKYSNPSIPAIINESTLVIIVVPTDAKRV